MKERKEVKNPLLRGDLYSLERKTPVTRGIFYPTKEKAVQPAKVFGEIQGNKKPRSKKRG
ncbi:MAG: hypothetical protein ABI683_15795 [Ginsengibacter sp.]